jgi:hypothetical protein
MNSRVFSFIFLFAVGGGTELRSAEAVLGVPSGKAQWIRHEGEIEVHELRKDPVDTRDLQRQLLLLTPPEIDAPSEEGTLGEPKLEELAPEKKVEELTPEKGPASKGLKEVCKGHSILNDVTAQTGESDHLYAKAYGSILNAFKVSKRVLEVGDGQSLAHSLHRWTSVFPQASVGGLVIGNVEPPASGTRTWTAEAGQHLNLGLIPQEAEGRAANSDIVIDRTGRDLGTNKYQLGTWLSAYHLVITGGLYVVEDVNALSPIDTVELPHEHPFCRLTFADPLRLDDEEVEQTGFSLSGEIGRAGFFLSTPSGTGSGDANMLVVAKHWPPREVHFYPEEHTASYYKVLNIVLRGEPVHRILSLLSSSGTAPWKNGYPQAIFPEEPEGCVDVVVTSAKVAAKHESWREDFVRGTQFLRKGGYAIIQDLDFTFCGRNFAPAPEDILGVEVAVVLQQNPDWFWAMTNDDDRQGSKLLVLRKQ